MELAQNDYFVIILGRKEHPEVKAICANAKMCAINPNNVYVAKDIEALKAIENTIKSAKKVGLVLQTTQTKEYLFEGLARVSFQYTGKTAFKGVYTAWDGTLTNWAKQDFRQSPEETYLSLVMNLPIREVLPDDELEQVIKGYENKTLEDFRKAGHRNTTDG